jgi:hypothetical protein
VKRDFEIRIYETDDWETEPNPGEWLVYTNAKAKYTSKKESRAKHEAQAKSWVQVHHQAFSKLQVGKEYRFRGKVLAKQPASASTSAIGLMLGGPAVQILWKTEESKKEIEEALRADHEIVRKLYKPFKKAMKVSNPKGRKKNQLKVAEATVADVQRLLPQIAKLAQEEYDAWEQNEEGMDEELGGGGICDRIAEHIQGELSQAGIESASGGQAGDDHAYVIMNLADGVYAIDIPPGVYESGGGYSWQKRAGVQISPEHVQIDKIQGPMSDEDFQEQFSEY